MISMIAKLRFVRFGERERERERESLLEKWESKRERGFPFIF